MGIDTLVFQSIHGFVGWSGVLDAAGVFFARYLPYILGIALVVFVFRGHSSKARVRTFLFLALMALLSRGILAESIRFFFPRVRPFDALGFTPLIPGYGSSFPSGHAAFFFTMSFAVFAINRKWGWWFFVLSALNGLARVFVGVHYPLDIVGGFLVALVSYLVCMPLFKTTIHHADEEYSETQEESSSRRETV